MTTPVQPRWLEALLERYPALVSCRPAIQEAATRLIDGFRRDGKLLICGNGGSAADSDHIVGELMKAFLRPRPVAVAVRERLIAEFPQEGAYLADHLQGALPAISLVSHHALQLAISNDVAADMIFAQQVFGYGRVGDVLLGISTSGNSRNVCHALRVGKMLGLTTIGLTGQDGGQVRHLCDVCICVPRHTVMEVQELHLPVYHALCQAAEEHFFA